MKLGIARLKRAFEEARDRWIQDHLSEGVVDQIVKRLLDSWVEKLVAGSLGLRDDWGRVAIAYDSPLAKALNEAAKKAAEEFVKNTLAPAFAALEVGKKDLQAIHAKYKNSFVDAALNVAGSIGIQAGEDFASKAIFDDPTEEEKK